MDVSFESLRDQMRQVHQRRHAIATVHHIGLVLAGILGLFLALSLVEMWTQFAPAGRITLLALFLAGSAALIWWSYRHLRQQRRDDRRTAHYIEDHMPDLEQRLLTSMDIQSESTAGLSTQLIEALWRDARDHVQERDLRQITTVRPAGLPALAAVAMMTLVAVTAWLSSDFLNAGKQVLWPWPEPGEPMVRIASLTVTPGDIRIRRGDDATIVARVDNTQPDRVQVFLQSDRVNWDQMPMSPEGDDGIWIYYLPAVTQDLTYYVDIGNTQSRQYQISVFDMPRVEHIDVSYTYPDYTGMAPSTEENGGDVVAPVGSTVKLRATFNKNIREVTMTFGNGADLAMDVTGTIATIDFVVTADSTYTLNALDGEQLRNENPTEFFIRAIPDDPPEVTLMKPGQDQRVTPLEEVPILASARDDYGLTDFRLHYSVAGQDEQEIRFLKAPKHALDVTVEGESILYLEELELEPGDFLIYFLTARDNNGIAGPAEVLSDMYFLEVISTDEEFMRARQQAGGGGQGGQQQRSSALVETQKQIIAATWKLLRQKSRMPPETFDADVTVVAESQTRVLQRAQMSLRRLAERFSFSDESYDNAVINLKKAVDYMHEAAEKLYSQDLQKALGPEQQALRSILKAEADGRRTQVQMARNRSSGGGGGGQQREREDLRELFEMEMGKLENRYEMPQQGGGGGGDQEGGEEDDTLARLRELAQRQERLNRAQQDLARRREQMTGEQVKRHLEELRREQEELSRQAESMSQQMSRLARQNPRQGQPPRQGQNNQQRQMEQAANQMREAAESLLRRDPDMAAAKSRKALENLRNQEKEMSSQQSASLANLVDDLNQRGQDLRSHERQVQKQLENIQKMRDNDTPHQLIRNSEEMRSLQDTKEQMKRDLAKAEEILRAVGAQGRRDQPDLADRAIETLRSLGAERLEDRIDESQQILQEGWLSLSMEMEKRINQSVDRVGRRLQELDQGSPRTEEEQLDQAATNARNLRRELEDLQQQVASMRRGAQQQQANARQQNGQQPGQSQQQAQQQGGGNRDGAINRLREGLQRSRRYARGLVQPWARGARWSSDARSIHRDLTQIEIEDFLNQPDLWNQLLDPIRDLEAALNTLSELSRIKKKLFSTQDEEVPTAYKHLVEEYYRALSEEPGSQE